MKRDDLYELWINALESGEFKQAKETLVDNTDAPNLKYCCLGVACVVAGLDEDEFHGRNYLPKTMQKKLGIKSDGEFKKPVLYRGLEYDSLAHMNDKGVRFKTIARIIREQREKNNFLKTNE